MNLNENCVVRGMKICLILQKKKIVKETEK